MARHVGIGIAIVVFAAGLTACDLVRGNQVDTVRVVDTVRLVDTVAPVRSLAGAGAIDPGAERDLPALGTTSDAPATDAELAVHVAYLRGRQLLLPVAGIAAASLTDTYAEARAGGARRHDALDIPAPRGTRVLSVDAGRIARIDTSDRGGLSLYATDPSGRYVYYYAHLDRYREGLVNGQSITRGELLGYVGTTGNAPPGVPHLHFGISVLGDPKRWWDGEPINPYPLLAFTRP